MLILINTHIKKDMEQTTHCEQFKLFHKNKETPGADPGF